MSNVRAFQCPNCQNYINNLLNSCKYCSMPLNQQTLSVAVSNEDFFNDAYNAASNLRISAGALATMFFASFIPVVGIFAGWVHFFLLIAVPLGLIFWLIKYSNIQTTNESYMEAKKYCWTAFFIWLGFVILRIVLIGMFFALMSAR